MPDNDSQKPPRVAIIMEVPPPKDYLTEALAEASIPVAAEYRAVELRPDQLDGVDVIIVTLDDAIDPYLDRVTEVVAGIDLPVLFEDSDYSSQLSGWDRNRWLRHLRAKIIGSDDTRPPLPEHAANSDQAPAEGQITGAQSSSRATARFIWVLGASIGGPESVRRLLEALPEDVPAALILVQHMGAEFQPVLAERLARVTSLDVRCAEDGQTLDPGRVIVAPVGERLTFDDKDRVMLTKLEVIEGPSPSIDHALFEVAEHFGDRAGAIILSGRDRDGLDGCAELKSRGGRVWAQDAASATVSAAPGAVREAGLAEYSGSPEQLAAKLIETCRATTIQENG